MPADSGNFLEQGATLLGPQRQRLIDHPLADEQERVVGEVCRVEQIDQVLEPDALAVEQVVALAGAIQAPPELEHRVVDGQQAVRIVQHERDVGHAQRGSLFGACEDHVLRLAGPQRPPLLAEGPAQGIGQIRLAGAVRTDDRADARPELDHRAFGKRFEALQAQAEQARGTAHRQTVESRPNAPRVTRVRPAEHPALARPPPSRLPDGTIPPPRREPGRPPSPGFGSGARDRDR